MKSKKYPELILKRLAESYPSAKCSLHHRRPHELLIATILSAQCTDKRVNRVTPALFRKYPTVKAFAESDIEELKADIRPTGFYNHKAESIRNSMRTIIEKFGGEVPRNLSDLTSLDGVGRKTANVVLGDAFNIPGIVVDTHVRRLSNRMGLTKNSVPEKIEQDLMKLFPPKQWTLLGHLMIDHGRSICIARKPKCNECFLNDICPSAETTQR